MHEDTQRRPLTVNLHFLLRRLCAIVNTTLLLISTFCCSVNEWGRETVLCMCVPLNAYVMNVCTCPTRWCTQLKMNHSVVAFSSLRSFFFINQWNIGFRYAECWLTAVRNVYFFLFSCGSAPCGDLYFHLIFSSLEFLFFSLHFVLFVSFLHFSFARLPHSKRMFL